MNTIVVDANIIFRALCSNRADVREIFSPATGQRLVSPRFLFVELFKHKERLRKASKLSEDELLEGLYAIMSRIQFINEAEISMGIWSEAYRLCRSVDENDTPYIAMCLHVKGCLWTADEELIKGLKSRGFQAFFEKL